MRNLKLFTSLFTMRKKLLIILGGLMFLSGFSQTLSSNLSKDKIALGEKAYYRVSINGLDGKSVVSKPKNELLPYHFEEVKDEISKSLDLYTRTIEFQIFDEGTYQIPELEFNVNGQILKTIPYEITVYNPANDRDQILDIMNNKQVKLGVKDYWELYKFYFLGALILLAAVFLFLVFFKKGFFRKDKKQELPINQTLTKLKKLQQKKYIQQGNYRLFYVELLEITRSFLTKQYYLPAEVLLTDDLIALMKKTNRISEPHEKLVEEILLRGDMVKFAKMLPNEEIMEEDFKKIYDFVIHSAEDLEAEHLREMQ